MSSPPERPFFEVTREIVFSASHQLRGYQGKCERIHGHDWTVRVAVRSGTLDATGLVIDFHDLDAMIRAAVADLENRLLNNTEPFRTDNPSAENIARLVAERVQKGLQRSDLWVDRAEVWENDRSLAIYYRSSRDAAFRKSV